MPKQDKTPQWLQNRYDAARERSEMPAEQAQLDALLARDADEPVGPGFDTRFFARLETAKQSKAGSSWWRWLTLAAIPAAAMAVAIWFWLPSTPQTGDVDIASFSEPEDIELARNLDMLEDFALLAQLDDVESYDLLAQVTLEELESAP